MLDGCLLNEDLDNPIEATAAWWRSHHVPSQLRRPWDIYEEQLLENLEDPSQTEADEEGPEDNRAEPQDLASRSHDILDTEGERPRHDAPGHHAGGAVRAAERPHQNVSRLPRLSGLRHVRFALE